MNRASRLVVTIVVIGALGFLGTNAHAAVGDTFFFNMQVAAGAASCLPNAKGRVTVSNVGPVENLHVEVFGLHPNADYDLFVIQVPRAPFGLAWYQGDIVVNHLGRGVGDFVGRFSRETFIIAPGVALVPQPVHPLDAIAGGHNPAITRAIHTFHLGLWFDSPKDATAAGCAGTTTPFNGDHTAGIQVLNTAGFPDTLGPLRSFSP